MEMARIDADIPWNDFVVLRLFRRWVAARTSSEATLPSLIPLAAELGEEAMVAVALDSVFHLTEQQLGRRLECECCCSSEIGADELAVILLLRSAPPPRLGLASNRIPHGLSASLWWAIGSARYALRVPSGAPDAGPAREAAGRCPFVRAREAPAAGESPRPGRPTLAIRFR